MSTAVSRYRLIRPREVRSSQFVLQEPWENFNATSRNVFDTTGYLTGQARASLVPSGFLIVERDAQPVLMTPYFVYYELMDDGIAPAWTRSERMRRFKHRTIPLGMPFAPGFKSIYLGTPFSEPANRFFTRPGIDIGDLAADSAVCRAYLRGLLRLQWEHFAPLVSHLSFENTPGNEAFFSAIRFEKVSCWPENYLDFAALRAKKCRGLMDQRAATAARIALLEAMEIEKKTLEAALAAALGTEATLGFAAHEKKYIAAAEAQLQIQNLEQGMRCDAVNADKKAKPLGAARERQSQALRDSGFASWEEIAPSSREKLLELLATRRALKENSSLLRSARDGKQGADVALASFEAANQKLTFEDYIQSLESENHRSVLRRNIKKLEANQADYPVEVLRNPADILPLVGEMYAAYNAQYVKAKTQWMRMTPSYLRHLVQLPGAEVVVCWHLQGGRKQFVGFIFNLDGQFNHRMGIVPGYNNPDDDHLIYFRLTLRNIEENMNAGHAGMWIAQTAYEMKRRLGFKLQPLYAYRRGVPLFYSVAQWLYQRLMGPIAAGGDELYSY